MEIKILSDRYKYRDDVEEQLLYWLSDLLAYIGVDPVILVEEDKTLSAEILFENGIDIVDYPTLGAVQVLYKGELIGEWAGPELQLKEDEDQKLYYEVTIECWSLLDDEIDVG